MSTLKIGIVGLGMVGEPLRRWFEKENHYVRGETLFCYDIDKDKPYRDDVGVADIIFVAVPTPPNPDGSCNTSLVESVCDRLPDGKIVVIKSTVPPGTTELLQDRHPDKRFLFNPEFLTESQAWEDFLHPARQLVGYTEKSRGDALELLLLLPHAFFSRPYISDYGRNTLSATEAEMVKYASNVFGYVKVVFGNILADMCCAATHAVAPTDYEHVRSAISADQRIGPAWLNVEHGAYHGAGGYCFPKDMDAFIAFSEELWGKLYRKRRDAHIREGFFRVYESGLNVLKAVRAYNEVLIAEQNLTMADVSRHIGSVQLAKRRPIRNSKK